MPFFSTNDNTDLALFTANFNTVNFLCYQCVSGKSEVVFNSHLICSAQLWRRWTGIDQTNPIAVPSTSPPSRGQGFKIGNMAYSSFHHPILKFREKHDITGESGQAQKEGELTLVCVKKRLE